MCELHVMLFKGQLSNGNDKQGRKRNVACILLYMYQSQLHRYIYVYQLFEFFINANDIQIRYKFFLLQYLFQNKVIVIHKCFR